VSVVKNMYYPTVMLIWRQDTSVNIKVGLSPLIIITYQNLENVKISLVPYKIANI